MSVAPGGRKFSMSDLWSWLYLISGWTAQNIQAASCIGPSLGRNRDQQIPGRFQYQPIRTLNKVKYGFQVWIKLNMVFRNFRTVQFPVPTSGYATNFALPLRAYRVFVPRRRWGSLTPRPPQRRDIGDERGWVAQRQAGWLMTLGHAICVYIYIHIYEIFCI